MEKEKYLQWFCGFYESDYASPSGRTRHVKNFHKTQMLVS